MIINSQQPISHSSSHSRGDYQGQKEAEASTESPPADQPRPPDALISQPPEDDRPALYQYSCRRVKKSILFNCISFNRVEVIQRKSKEGFCKERSYQLKSTPLAEGRFGLIHTLQASSHPKVIKIFKNLSHDNVAKLFFYLQKIYQRCIEHNPSSDRRPKGLAPAPRGLLQMKNGSGIIFSKYLTDLDNLYNLPVQVYLRGAFQMCLGLACLHRAGFHRGDSKPANELLRLKIKKDGVSSGKNYTLDCVLSDLDSCKPISKRLSRGSYVQTTIIRSVMQTITMQCQADRQALKDFHSRRQDPNTEITEADCKYMASRLKAMDVFSEGASRHAWFLGKREYYLAYRQKLGENLGVNGKFWQILSPQLQQTYGVMVDLVSAMTHPDWTRRPTAEDAAQQFEAMAIALGHSDDVLEYEAVSSLFEAIGKRDFHV